ncbi:MAG: hypothetical protein HZB92_08990 [Euryarchaeota archaeon]|nr:hypothetical protein [Euryarchaeota archaeon]
MKKGALALALAVSVLLTAFPMTIGGDRPFGAVLGPPGGDVYVIDGDWYVDGPLSYFNSVFYLTGNLTVNATGSLALINTTLRMNCSADAQYHILVNGSMRLADFDSDPATDGDMSMVAGNDSTFSYGFSIASGGSLEVTNSEVSGAGLWNGADGLEARDTTVSMSHAALSDSTTGLRLISSSASLSNVAVSNCSVGVQLIQTDAFIRDLNVTGCAIGLGVSSSLPDIARVSVSGGLYGIYLQSSSPSIYGAAVAGAAVAAVYAQYSSPLVCDGTLEGASAFVSVGDSYPCLVNVSFNHSALSMDSCAYVSVGEHTSALVVDEATGLPVGGLKVSILDSEMATASEGSTDATGLAVGLAYRSSMIFSDREEVRLPMHAYAYGMSAGVAMTGLNASAPMPQVEVRVANRTDWRYFDGDTYLPGGEATYENMTVVARGGVYVQAGSKITLRNSTMLFAPPPDKTIGLYTDGGMLAVEGSLLCSAGARRPLTPVPFAVTVSQSSTGYFTNPDIRWSRDVMLLAPQTWWSGGGVSFASQNGVSAGMNTVLNLSGASFTYCKTGINAYYCSMAADNVGVSRSISAAVLLTGGANELNDISIDKSPYGIYAYGSDWSASGASITNSTYGVYSVFGTGRMDRASVSGAASFAAFGWGGELDARDSSLSSPYTGVYVGYGGGTIDNCTVAGNSFAVYADSASPVVSNSTLSGGTHFYVGPRSFPTALNSSFSEGKVSVSDSSYLAVGGYVSVRAFDQTPAPLDGARAFLFDAPGNPVDERVCVGPAWMGFRDHVLTTEGAVSAQPATLRGFYHGAEFMAGSMATKLSQGDYVELNMTNSSAYWWDGGIYVDSNESYSNQTIYTNGNVTVVKGGDLALRNVSLFLAPGDGMEKFVSVAQGNLTLDRSNVSACGAYAPGNPKRFQFKVEDGARATMNETLVNAPYSLISDRSTLSLANSSVLWPGQRAVSISSSWANATNLSIDWCSDGIYADGKSVLDVNGLDARHASNAGLNAYDSNVFIEDLTVSRSTTGARFTGCAGALLNALLSSCYDGLGLTGTTVPVSGLWAHDNINAGILITDCYPEVLGSNLSFNGVGAYLSDAGPVFNGTEFWGNTYGMLSSSSGPLVSNCTFGGNDYGIYATGNLRGVEETLFSTGTGDIRASFIDGGAWQKGGISYPARARLTNISLDLEGALMKNVPLTYDDAPQLKPAIWQDRVVWMDKRGGDWDIYTYNLSVDSDGDGVPNYMEWPKSDDDPALTRLSRTAANQYNPSIWGDLAAWTDLGSGLSKACLYSLANRTEWCVSDDPAQQEWEPCVGEDYVVWSADDAGDADIWALSLANSTYYPFNRNADGDDLSPDVWGDAVVWWNFSSEGPWSPIFADIWKGNLSSGDASDITGKPDGALQHLPAVDERWVAWQDNRNGDRNGDGVADWDIYAMDRATGNETLVTNDKISHFCPELWGDMVTWYSVDYSNYHWGVHVQNITTGEHTVIEENAKIDGRPAIWGPRVVFVNQSRGVPDIYLYDSRYVGYPSDVTLDVGADGADEFLAPGTYAGVTHLGRDALASEVSAHAIVNGTLAYVPMEIASSATGTVIAANLSLVYDLDSVVASSEFSGSSQYSVFCEGASITLENASFADEDAPARLAGASELAMVNCTLGSAGYIFEDGASVSTEFYFLHVRVVNTSGAPIEGADVRAVDNGNGTYNEKYPTDANGYVNWTRLVARSWNSTGMVEYSPYELTVTKPGYDTVNYSADMDASLYVTIVLGDTQPPMHSDEAPSVSGYAYNTTPVVSVRVTDASGVVESSIDLYVNGSKVVRVLEPVGGGYIVSYWHEEGFSEGQVVGCRIVAVDTLGNDLDFTWNFTVLCSWTRNLSAGWNLISLPMMQVDPSLEKALGSTSGRWDRVQWYDPLDPANPWKQYYTGWAPSLNDMPPLNHTMGFWLNVSSNITLTVKGLWANSTSVPLHKGWNMVGYPTQNDTMTASIAFWGTGADIVEAFDPTAPYKTKSIGPNYVLKPGEGYWIHVPTDSVWTVAW